MGWLTTAPIGVVLSKRVAVTPQRINSYWVATPVYQIITLTTTVTVTEYRSMTQACAESLANTVGWNSATVDQYGVITSSSTAEVSRQNEADAYKVTRTVTSTVRTTTGWINA